MTLRYLHPGVWANEIEVDKRLKGVVVVVTVVIDPLITTQVGEEGTQAPIVCETAEPQKCSGRKEDISPAEIFLAHVPCS